MKQSITFFKGIILSFTIMFISITHASAQGFIAQEFNASSGNMNIIPGRYMKSGESAISYMSQENENVSVSIYGKGFKELKQLSFTIPSSYPSSSKTETATVNLDQLINYNVEVCDQVKDSLTIADTLITIYNKIARHQNENIDNYSYDYMGNTEKWPLFNDITTSEIFAQIMGKFDYYNIQSLFSYTLRVDEFTLLSNVKTTNGKIASYPLYTEEEGYYSYNRYGYYNPDMHGDDYPLYYATVENGIVYLVYQNYSSSYFINIPDELNWKSDEYNGYDERYYMEHLFSSSTYINADELINSNGVIFTQTLFNNDEKYEFVKREYEIGDWIMDMDYYETDSVLSYYNYDEYIELQIVNHDKFNGYRIKTDYYYDYNGNRVPIISLTRRFERDIRRNTQVVSDDGTVLFEYKCTIPRAYSSAHIMTFNGTDYLIINEYNDKDTEKTVIYEINKQSNAVKVIERVSQPFATAHNGIINMKLDDSHTDSNAELYNMSGQSVGRRYINKGETTPSMNATGLPEGIYDLILNQNGKSISSQKMVIQ